MNNYVVYAIWAILPVALLLLSMNAITNRIFKVKPKEDGVDYFKQFLFVLFAFGLSVLFDQYAFPHIVDYFQIDQGVQFLIALMAFPVILWLCTEVERRIRRIRNKGKGSKLKGTYDYTT